jgi:hypothetical protein
MLDPAAISSSDEDSRTVCRQGVSSVCFAVGATQQLHFGGMTSMQPDQL